MALRAVNRKAGSGEPRGHGLLWGGNSGHWTGNISFNPLEDLPQMKTEAPDAACHREDRWKMTCQQVPEPGLEPRSLGDQCKLEGLVEVPLPEWSRSRKREQHRPVQGPSQ